MRIRDSGLDPGSATLVLVHKVFKFERFWNDFFTEKLTLKRRYRPACVLAGVPGLAACEGEGEEVPLARDLHPVRQLVVQRRAVPAHNKECY